MKNIMTQKITRNKIIKILIVVFLLSAIGVTSIYAANSAAVNPTAEATALFSCEPGAEVSGLKKLPDYFGANYFDTPNGAAIKFTRDKSKVTFNSLIDLDSLKSNPFIELQIVPKNRTLKELTYLYVTLTDAYDSSSSVTVKLQSADVHTYSQLSFVAASANNLYTPQGHQMNSENYNEYGSAAAMTFYGRRDGFAPRSVKFAYNNDEKAVYVDPCEWNNKFQVIQFDDPLLGGKFEAFKGFSSGKAILSLYADEIIGSEANVLVQEVGGKSVEELAQQKFGKVDFHVNNGKLASFDNAIAGGSYKVWDSIAYNNKRFFDKPIAKVTYGDSKIVVPVRDGRFETKQDGNYTVIYETVFNTVKYHSDPIIVTALKKYEQEISLELDEKLKSVSYIGEPILLYSGRATGGIGKLTINQKVTLNGKSIEQYRNGKFMCFKPTEVGAYNMAFTASDERGGVGSVVNHTVNVVHYTIPTFVEPYLAQSLAKDVAISFPAVATKYTTVNGDEATKTEILIGGVDYFKKDYLPKMNFDVTYKVSSLSDLSKFSEKTYSIKVVDAAATNGTMKYISNPALYFVTNNIDISYRASGMIFSAKSAGNADLGFIKKVFSDDFGLEFLPKSAENIQCTLYDEANTDNIVSLSIEQIYPAKGYVKLLLNGNYVKQIKGEIGVTTFSLNFNAKEQSFYDSDGNFLVKVDAWQDGTEFDGFSEFVYLQMKMNGATIGSSIELRTIAKQSFGSNDAGSNMRAISPVIVYTKSFAGLSRAKRGDKFIVRGAKAFDVLGSLTSFELSIQSPGSLLGDIFSGSTPQEDFAIDLNRIGAYNISYTAINSFGRTQRDTIIITVYDNTPPVISINGQLKSSYTVSQMADIPTATAKDNKGGEVAVYIYVEEPYGYARRVTDGKYKFLKVGVYTIKYYAIDSNACYELKEFKVVCK